MLLIILIQNSKMFGLFKNLRQLAVNIKFSNNTNEKVRLSQQK